MNYIIQRLLIQAKKQKEVTPKPEKVASKKQLQGAKALREKIKNKLIK